MQLKLQQYADIKATPASSEPFRNRVLAALTAHFELSVDKTLPKNIEQLLDITVNVNEIEHALHKSLPHTDPERLLTHLVRVDSTIFRFIRELNQAWECIYDEYLKLYGIPQSFQDYCNKKIQAGEAFAESLIQGQSWKRAIYEMLNEEAESAIANQQTEEFEKVLAYTSKKVGFRINPKDMTVREFYGYLNLAEDNGK